PPGTPRAAVRPGGGIHAGAAHAEALAEVPRGPGPPAADIEDVLARVKRTALADEALGGRHCLRERFVAAKDREVERVAPVLPVDVGHAVEVRAHHRLVARLAGTSIRDRAGELVVVHRLTPWAVCGIGGGPSHHWRSVSRAIGSTSPGRRNDRFGCEPVIAAAQSMKNSRPRRRTIAAHASRSTG